MANNRRRPMRVAQRKPSAQKTQPNRSSRSRRNIAKPRRSQPSASGRRSYSDRNVRSGNIASIFTGRNLIIAGAGLLVVVLLIMLLAGVFSGSKTFVAEQGTLNFTLENSGLVVRKETSYKAENYGKTEFIAKEGQAVSKGTAIADAYSWDYNEKDYNDLKELQEKIMDYLEASAQNTIKVEDIQDLNALITAKTAEVFATIKGTAFGNLDNLERDLTLLMEERSKLYRDNTKTDDQLTTYYGEETALLTRIQDYKNTIVAEEDGLVSFYFDGKEPIMTVENLETLSVKNFNEIMQGKQDYIASEGGRPLYRLVNRNEWNVMMVTNKAVPEFAGKTTFEVQFSFGEDYKYQGVIASHREEGGKHIYVLQFSQDIDKMLMARQVSFSVSASYTGIQVPKNVIKKKEGLLGVYYQVAGKKVFEPIEVLIEQDGQAIIRSTNISTTLQAGSTIYQ